MQLHQLKPTTKSKNKKRIGRGGKRGTYSGRGVKGQKARAGRKIKPGYLETIKRLPKLRGFKNKPLQSKTAIINLSDLEKIIKGNIIDRKTLLKAGLIRKSNQRIKILGGGEVKRSFKVEGLEISKSAKNKIKTAGDNAK